ncbi:MAG: RNA polymerase subunit sigma-70, partial [Planctomycetaceae bacterium]|nr:RNA polymerase subunit sigma-70 [Planctomycetaceae bacterium]
MDFQETDLKKLIEKGKSQGYLTFNEVANYLPDETVGSEKIDNLIVAVESSGIELREKPPESAMTVGPSAEELIKAEAELSNLQIPEKLPRPSDDPIRMYLSQMSEIPLLTRDEEISLAKRIEIARKRYRRAVLSCYYAHKTTTDTLKRVYAGE